MRGQFLVDIDKDYSERTFDENGNIDIDDERKIESRNKILNVFYDTRQEQVLRTKYAEYYVEELWILYGVESVEKQRNLNHIVIEFGMLTQREQKGRHDNRSSLV